MDIEPAVGGRRKGDGTPTGGRQPTLAACKLSNSEICNDSKHCRSADKRRNERCTN